MRSGRILQLVLERRLRCRMVHQLLLQLLQLLLLLLRLRRPPQQPLLPLLALRYEALRYFYSGTAASRYCCRSWH